MRKFKSICCADFETFYSKDYSLRSLPTSVYIRDPRFRITAVSIQHEGDAEATVHIGEIPAMQAMQAVDWTTTAFLAHHTQFDGFILSHHLGIVPCFYLDTLSMGRALHGVEVGGSLEALCQRYGLKGKVHRQALVNMMGVEDPLDLSPEQLDEFIEYSKDDTEQTLELFTKMVQQYPVEELQIIDMTVRMFCDPRLLINEELAGEINAREINRKLDLLGRIGYDRDVLSSNDKFAAALSECGVPCPTKISPRTGETIPAVSLADISFKALREHPDPLVRDLIEARIAIKSTILETRSEALAERAKVDESFPVYLKYCGAHTHRWSGGDKINPQNLDKKSGLREALIPPPGCVINIADSSQIEARTNAWRSGQQDLVQGFRDHKDVYRITAGHAIYQKPAEEVTEDERFVGKTCVLGLGFGMGPAKFRNTLRIGQFGPPVDMPLERCADIVRAFRYANSMIVAEWGYTNHNVRAAFLSSKEVEDGIVTYEGYKGDGYIHVPGGLFMKYREINVDNQGEMSYLTRYGRTKLYGGLLVENIVQCLARRIVAEQMLAVQEQLDTQIVTCTHDEIVCVTSKDKAEEVQAGLIRLMSVPPSWAPDLPLAAEGNFAEVYKRKK